MIRVRVRCSAECVYNAIIYRNSEEKDPPRMPKSPYTAENKIYGADKHRVEKAQCVFVLDSGYERHQNRYHYEYEPSRMPQIKEKSQHKIYEHCDERDRKP